MKVKVCGMKYSKNIWEISGLEIDMIGFIFYRKSARYVGRELDVKILNSLPDRILKTGVFADEDLLFIHGKHREFNLDYIQLHGNETTEDCRYLKEYEIRIIKAFSIDNDFDFKILDPYQPYCDYFLFDSKGPLKGGNSVSFQWEILSKYQLNTPFLLSGGIGLENIQDALRIKHPQLAGFDLNSKLETEPAYKSYEITKKIIEKIKNHDRN